MKKLNRQERVVEEVKLVLKPHYNKKHVTKEQYKDILRRAVPKVSLLNALIISISKLHFIHKNRRRTFEIICPEMNFSKVCI